jgi:hypothetical protein
MPYSRAATLARLFRENPPFQPKRFYKLTRDGQWLRMADGSTFAEVKPRKIVPRIPRPWDGER